MSGVWMVVSFIGGLAVGSLWREAFELIKRKDDPVEAIRRTRINTLALVLIALAFAFPAIVGLMVYTNGNNDSRRVDCQVAYNRQAGLARDERLKAQNTAAAAELVYVREDLRYQRGLLEQLRNGTSIRPLVGVIETRIVANERYLHTLLKQQSVRASADYPPYNMCGKP